VREMKEVVHTAPRVLSVNVGAIREIEWRGEQVRTAIWKHPVAGRITAAFGDTRASGVKWDGLVVATERGAPVKAVSAGRVVYADWLPGLGLLVLALIANFAGDSLRNLMKTS